MRSVTRRIAWFKYFQCQDLGAQSTAWRHRVHANITSASVRVVHQRLILLASSPVVVRTRVVLDVQAQLTRGHVGYHRVDAALSKALGHHSHRALVYSHGLGDARSTCAPSPGH